MSCLCRCLPASDVGDAGGCGRSRGDGERPGDERRDDRSGNAAAHRPRDIASIMHSLPLGCPTGGSGVGSARDRRGGRHGVVGDLGVASAHPDSPRARSGTRCRRLDPDLRRFRSGGSVIRKMGSARGFGELRLAHASLRSAEVDVRGGDGSRAAPGRSRGRPALAPGLGGVRSARSGHTTPD